MPKDVPRFWREIPQRYNLIGNQCDSCGKVFFPPRVSCPYCRRKSIGKMQELKLSGKGEIANKIISIAQKNDIPIRDDPVLAAALATIDRALPSFFPN